MVRIKKSNRGFSHYGDSRKDQDGIPYKVVQSSVDLNSCRLYIDDPIFYIPYANGTMNNIPALHLNRKQVSSLINILNTFLRDTK